jgi:hypothetical protein
MSTVNGAVTFPSVVSHTDNTVTLGFNTGAQEVQVEMAKTMIKGQARWAAKRLAEKGAVVPEYGTKECRIWALSLRQACGMNR